MSHMSLIEIILLGIGLAMDCFAVSLSKGIAARKLYAAGAATMAVFFGLFQAGMPLIGYFAGVHFASFISRVAPWIALVLLGFIGGKMIWEHFSPDDDDEHADADYRFGTVVVLSVATSIDALATGLIFVGQEQVIWLAVAVIGICSTLFSAAGTLLGVFVGGRFRFPAELVGGVILVCIGLKIWVEAVVLGL